MEPVIAILAAYCGNELLFGLKRPKGGGTEPPPKPNWNIIRGILSATAGFAIYTLLRPVIADAGFFGLVVASLVTGMAAGAFLQDVKDITSPG